MVKTNFLLHKFKRKWTSFRLQPIRVFCFHQVCEEFNPNVYCKPDWISLSEFKQKIQHLRKDGYIFISLQEAHRHLKEDIVRCKKYAVLTCDDGLKCQAALIPWLEEEKIPITMFITTKYLDGKSCGPQILDYFKITDKETERKLAEQLYLNEEELNAIDSPMVTIGMHSYEHINSNTLGIDVFGNHIKMCLDALQSHKRYIPFYAYPYGIHNRLTDEILIKANIIPVLADGERNYNDLSVIHREILEM